MIHTTQAARDAFPYMWIVVCVMADGGTMQSAFGSQVGALACAERMKQQPDVLSAHVIEPKRMRTP